MMSTNLFALASGCKATFTLNLKEVGGHRTPSPRHGPLHCTRPVPASLQTSAVCAFRALRGPFFASLSSYNNQSLQAHVLSSMVAVLQAGT